MSHLELKERDELKMYLDSTSKDIQYTAKRLAFKSNEEIAHELKGIAEYLISLADGLPEPIDYTQYLIK